MNILKDCKNNLTTAEFIAKCTELGKIGRTREYFSDKKLCTKLNDLFYYEGNSYIKDFIQIIKNNKNFNNEIRNITIANIVDDKDETSISIILKDKLIKIDFKNKTIYGYNNNTFIYKNDFILTPINNREKADIIEVLFDANDSTTNFVLNNWSDYDKKILREKFPLIIDKMPNMYKREFEFNKFSDKFASVNVFTIIGKTGMQMHCIYNNKENIYSCCIR